MRQRSRQQSGQPYWPARAPRFSPLRQRTEGFVTAGKAQVATRVELIARTAIRPGGKMAGSASHAVTACCLVPEQGFAQHNGQRTVQHNAIQVGQLDRITFQAVEFRPRIFDECAFGSAEQLVTGVQQWRRRRLLSERVTGEASERYHGHGRENEE